MVARTACQQRHWASHCPASARAKTPSGKSKDLAPGSRKDHTRNQAKQITICVALICLLGFRIKAQNPSINPVALEVNGHLVMEANGHPVIVNVDGQPLIVEVNGKDYNTQRSILFKRISAEVKAVYTTGVLFNWVEKRPLYGSAPTSDSLVSEGNFLGTSSSGVLARERPIIGYKTISSKDILVLNFRSGVASGEQLTFRAMQVGATNFGGNQIELWDCGKPYVPTPEEIAAAKAAQAEAKAEAKAKAAEQKKKAAEIALKSNEDSAAKGEWYGLERMGERYRDGDGVEKDLSKAKEYLQKAADAGSLTAADELSKLKQ